MKRLLLAFFFLAIWTGIELYGQRADEQVQLYLDSADAYKYSDPEKALMFLQKVSASNNLSEIQKKSHLNLLSLAHYVSGHFDSAAYYDGLVLERAIATGDERSISSAYNGLGLIYNSQGKYDQAASSHAKGLEIALKLSDSLLMAKHLINGSIALYDRPTNARLDSALILLNRASDILTAIHHNALLAMTYNHRGVVKTKSKNYTGASIDHEKALSLTEKDNLWELSFGLSGKSEALLGLGKVSESMASGKKALDIALKLNALWEIQRITYLLAKGNEKSGNYQEAYGFYVMHKEYSDSLFNKDKEEEMNAALLKLSNFENRVLTQDKEMVILEAQKARVTLYYLIGILVILLALSGVLYRYYQQKLKLNRTLMDKNRIIVEQHKSLKDLDKKKDQILSVISHDMRSPINTIAGMVYMIKDQVELSDPMIGVIKNIENQTHQLNMTLTDLLHWSRAQFVGAKAKKESVEVSKVVAESLDLLKQQIDDKQLKISQASIDACAYADYQQVSIVMRNLLSNAIKFSNHGDNIEIGQTVEKDHVIVSVKDHGIGMDEEEIEELMAGKKQSSYGTKNESGTGFGFSLCVLYVQENRGEIAVESTKGAGTTVTMKLPLCNEQSA
jgi:signal transduction histidine kinase